MRSLWRDGILVVAAVTTCQDEGGVHEAPSAKVAEFSGCTAVSRAGVCEIGEQSRDIVVWFDETVEHPRVSFAEETLQPSAVETTGGGTRVRVRVPWRSSGDANLVVTFTRPESRRPFVLPIRHADVDPAIVRANALRKEGRLEAARQALAVSDHAREPVQARRESVAARIALASGDVDAAIRGLRHALEMHRREGRVSDEALDAMALSHSLLTHGARIAEARKALDEAESAFVAWDEGRAEVGYYRALVARDAGDLRLATRELATTHRNAERLGLANFGRRAHQLSARLAERTGRLDEARTELSQVLHELPVDVSACERAEVMTNLGWIDLVALEGGSRLSASGMDAQTTHLEKTLALWQDGCPKPAEIANARTNLALAALWAGNVSAAIENVRKAKESSVVPAFVAFWLLDVEARIALARSDPKTALGIYEELERRARASFSPEPTWRAYVGRGNALEAVGDIAGAERAYRDAEAVLDEQASTVAVHTGATFLGLRDRSARLLADLLVATGRPDDALDVVRAARIRAIRAVQRLDRVAALSAEARARWEDGISRYAHAQNELEAIARDDWTLPADRLPLDFERRRARGEAARLALDDAFAALPGATPRPFRQPSPGELLLAFQPRADGSSLRGYARTTNGTTVRDIRTYDAHSSPAEIAEHLVAPFEQEIERAKKIRVLTYGPLAHVDLHAVRWRGAPLLAHVPVEYPADLDDTAPESPSTSGGAPRALVVADTHDDLPAAMRESGAVVASLRGAFDTLALVGASADRTAVLTDLARASAFHFAGHASFRGEGDWASALELAQGTSLRIGDVLTLPHAPATVVLSACESGKAVPTPVADMGLADAFLAAGSKVVIAPTRRVGDRLAAKLVADVYASASAGGWAPAEGLRAAQLRLIEQAPESDWAAYRVFTR